MEAAAAKISTRGYHVVRIAVATLLLLASGLKCWQLLTEPTLRTSVLDDPRLLLFTVEFELFFGLWLLANVLPRPTWYLALGCFGLFTCVSLFKAVAGHATCGCFGVVKVNPWYTAALDVSLVVMLLHWRPSGWRFSTARAACVLSVWMVIVHAPGAFVWVN